MGKDTRKKLWIFFIFSAIFVMSLFFGLKNVKAAGPPADPPKIVINEVMIMPDCKTTESDCEWVELFNNENYQVELGGWTISDNSESITLPDFTLLSKDYLIIAVTDENFQNFAGNLIILNHKIGNGLANGGDRLILKNADGVIDQISWGSDKTILNPSISAGSIKGSSIERKPAGFDTDKASDFIIQAKPTPGAGIPKSVILDDPEINGDTVSFFWSKAEENDFLKYEIYLSETSGKLGDKLDELNALEDNFYEIGNLVPGRTYYFTIKNYNLAGVYNDSNQVSIFLPIIYSNAIIINELMPNPTGSQASGEWIELYNGSNEIVNLKNWVLEDIAGTTHKYVIVKDLIINPLDYVVIFRSQSGITLNDSGDGVALYQPNGNLLYQTPEFTNADDNIAWARGPDGSWSWTTTPTPQAENKIVALAAVAEQNINNNPTPEPINTIPIEISTGDYQNYENKLVKVTGKVTETSGDTFYLDDGSGEVKIYIQEKTGIDKPEMHKNDIFEVTGIVDLYGTTWRILPQNQDDIKLIEAAERVVLSSTAKTSTKKTATTKKASTATSKSAVKKAKAASDAKLPTEVKSEKIKSSFWIQIAEAGTGLAVILFILLIVRIIRQPKPKILGGHFGDDET